MAQTHHTFGFFSLANLRDIFSIDLRTLALFRILLAVAQLYSLYVLWFSMDAFLTDDGLIQRVDLVGNPFRFSLYFINGSYGFTAFLMAVHTLAALCLLVGYRVRLAAFTAWVLGVSLIGRAYPILQGGDVLLPLLMFWAIFLPVGKVFSIDAALRDEHHRDDAPHFSVATVGLLLQVVYVYVFGALLKTGSEWVQDGTAVYYALHLDTFATPFGVFVRQFPSLMVGLTFFVYWLELLTPVFLFWPDRLRRVRAAALFLLVAMHFGFRIFMNIGHFWLVSLASLSSFVSRPLWQWWCRIYYRPSTKNITLYYDQDCGFCLKTCQIFREFFLPRSVPIIPAQSVPEIGEILERETSWVVTDGDGNIYLHWEAVVFVMKQSVLLRPLMWLAALYGRVGLGQVTYNIIGRNRHFLGRISSAVLKPSKVYSGPHIFTSIFLTFVVAVSFLWNVREEVGGNKISFVPDTVWDAARIFGFGQRWSMFAPKPAAVDVRPFITGVLETGDVVDFTYVEGGAYADIAGEEFSSYRWRTYINRISFYGQQARDYHYKRYSRYVCSVWNANHSGGDKLVQLNIKLVKHHTLVNYQRERSVLNFGHWRCP